MPWIDDDTLKALSTASWQSASIPDGKESPTAAASGIEDIKENSTTTAPSQVEKESRNNANKTVESPEMAKLDELIQSLSEL